MSDVTDVLAKIPIFADVNEEGLLRLKDITSVKTFKKRRFVFMEGEKRDAVYFINSGVVKSYHIDEEGNQQVISILHEGDMFPHVGFFDHSPYPATVEVIQDAELIVIRIDDFNDLMIQHPQIAISVMKVMGKKLIQLQERVQSFISQDVEHRFIRVLLDLAAEHGIEKGDGILIDFPVTNQDFANIVGTSRETINRILNQFKRQQILTPRRNGIHIQNIDKLKDLN